MDKDWAEAFKALLDSDLGKELVRTLKKDLHQNLIDEAEKSVSQETAFGLIKEARGVIKTIEHLQFRAVVAKDKGGKG
jgi:hypothetical protein